MLNHSYLRLAFALALILTFAAPGGTQPMSNSNDRILGPIDAAQTAVVQRTAHPMARPQFDQGRTDTTKQLSGVSLNFRLSAAQQADLNQLLRDQQDRSSPLYHKWLTPDQYAVRFGMTKNDLAKVAAWAQSQGLSVDSVSRNRNEISFSGTVGQIEYALKTQLHNYSVNSEQHFANATDVALPAAFASQVLSVRGLDDFRPKPRFRTVPPRFTSSLSGVHNLVPGDFVTIYDLPAAFNGSGQTIAVVGQTAISNSDIDAFRSASGLAANDPVVTLVPGSGTLTHFAGDETEADLDLEWSGGIAPSATIKYVTVGNNTNFNVFDSFGYAIQNNVAPVISISYGNCEANLGAAFVLTMQQQAQEANAQGQTISGPAGDQGAADCESAGATSDISGLAVDVPAAIPEVTGVGGTEFTGDATACPGNPPTCSGGVAPPTMYWNGSSSPTSGASALIYIPEIAWNDTVPGSTFSASGGGASSIFGKPSWQSGTGVPSDGKRDVPDVAFSASPGHDGYLICSQDYVNQNDPGFTSCSTGFRDSNQIPERIGGTSAGAPTFAGILALINQATSSHGLGNVNPMLYGLNATTPGAFHDITSGNNNVPCTSGTPNCAAGTTTIGFSAGVGYDQVTGLGSLDVAKLITAWIAATPPAADFAMDGLVTSVPSPGASGMSTVTVSALGGFTGMVTLTCAPTQTTVQITCSMAPPSVTLTAGAGHIQTSTLMINTAAARLDSPAGGRPRTIWLATSVTWLLATVVLCAVPSRRSWRNGMLGLLLLASISTITSCGGGSSSSSGGGGGGGGTPTGTYTIKVTGTGPSTSHSATVSVKVS